METTTKSPSKHIGKKISRIRELRGIKQDALAEDLGISQQTISRIEKSETIEEETLEKIAQMLEVDKEAIKNFSEEGMFNYFNIVGEHGTGINNNCTFNPLDKLMEVVDENRKLYKQLLESKKEKVALLKAQIKHNS